MPPARWRCRPALGFGRTDARTALHLWPSFIDPELYRFLVKNMRSGTLDKLQVRSQLSVETFERIRDKKPLPDDAVSTEFTVTGAALQIVDGLPPLTNASFQGRSSGRIVALKDIEATLAPGSGRTLTLNEGMFDIADLGKKPVEARTQFRLGGSVEAVLDLLAQPAMQGVMPMQGQIDGVKGQFDGLVSVTLPIVDKPAQSSIVTTVKATLSNVVADRLFGKERFEAAQLQLAVQPGLLTLKGEGKVGGMAANIDFVQPRRDSEDAIMSLTMDDAARAKRGLNLGTQLTGPIVIKIKSDFPANAKTGLRSRSIWRRPVSTGCCRAGPSRPARPRGRSSR